MTNDMQRGTKFHRKRRAKELREDGRTVKEIARALRCSTSSVRRYLESPEQRTHRLAKRKERREKRKQGLIGFPAAEATA